jgi:hypothetical protein
MTTYHYLIIHDRPSGELVRLERFEDSKEALNERFKAERWVQAGEDREIVVLSASSLADLRRTHGRYFLTLSELSERALSAGR